ncbi:hypothetical protein TTX_1260 [Thermoproteus tenax Kra 1]|uniref:Uncharacterized protein n=1 Tax=Thermoproteus tenax (strain ATCC 35583 / DSM 2078 / JCM 9277 / NBRC 100435 / Kra 1) TaxID=768679 RepID=G4RK00_THETK|nr:hypothetical protein TTX_1260 [Thermoproteus tenax Kra 1]
MGLQNLKKRIERPKYKVNEAGEIELGISKRGLKAMGDLETNSSRTRLTGESQVED